MMDSEKLKAIVEFRPLPNPVQILLCDSVPLCETFLILKP
jgi:hypothetical protein